jgi:hypothetical protein
MAASLTDVISQRSVKQKAKQAKQQRRSRSRSKSKSKSRTGKENSTSRNRGRSGSCSRNGTEGDDCELDEGDAVLNRSLTNNPMQLSVDGHEFSDSEFSDDSLDGEVSMSVSMRM